MAKMDLRPSKIGLLNIALNPNQRGQDKTKGTALDRLNERLASKGNEYFHPTKGKREISAKRSKAAQIAAEIRHGMFPFSMTAIRRELALTD